MVIVRHQNNSKSALQMTSGILFTCIVKCMWVTGYVSFCMKVMLLDIQCCDWFTHTHTLPQTHTHTHTITVHIWWLLKGVLLCDCVPKILWSALTGITFVTIWTSNTSCLWIIAIYCWFSFFFSVARHWKWKTAVNKLDFFLQSSWSPILLIPWPSIVSLNDGDDGDEHVVCIFSWHKDKTKKAVH